MERQSSVHEALCDNIDTKTTLDHIRHLVTSVNNYLASAEQRKVEPNGKLLESIAKYVTKIFKVGTFSSYIFLKERDLIFS